MAETSVLAETAHGLAAWQSLAELAVRGLRATYSAAQDVLPHTRRWDGRRATCEGCNVRYALISLLGLAKGATIVGPQNELVGSLWQQVASTGTEGLSAGDLGLGLWAQALHSGGVEAFSADRVLSAYRREASACDSVDLAWLLLGAEHAVLAGLNGEEAERLADASKRNLLALYNPETCLLYRHARRGLANRVARRVACFAHQIYPVMALSVHAHRTGCKEAAAAASAVANKLCQLQGPLGQWWWLYDVQVGQIVDGYPVFAVHQDGMAPMALLEASTSSDRRYSESIERGLRWIYGSNELGTSLVLRRQSLILRDIHRRGVGRARRMISGTLWCCGWRGCRKRLPSSTSFEVNTECRPYHLGWVLYAAGLII